MCIRDSVKKMPPKPIGGLLVRGHFGGTGACKTYGLDEMEGALGATTEKCPQQMQEAPDFRWLMIAVRASILRACAGAGDTLPTCSFSGLMRLVPYGVFYSLSLSLSVEKQAFT